jgi:hypothetical protein
MRAPILLALVAIQGCAPTIAVRPSSGYCGPPSHSTFRFEPDVAPSASASREERMAALLGLGSVLAERLAARELSTEARVRVLERIELARLSVTATSAELDCDAERADQTADYLSGKEASAVQGLTIASLVVAAGSAIAGVLLSTSNARASTQDAVAISGGAVTAGLGLAILGVHPRVDYGHPRNLLADVWRGPTESSTFPPIVWAYLSRREFSNQQQQSIRERIGERWSRYRGIARDPTDVALLFGTGGRYDAALLRTRSRMLGEVRAEVDLMNQDIESLAAALIR